MELKSHIENTLPSCTVIISEPTIRLDSAKGLTIKHINEKLRNMNINMLRNDNITCVTTTSQQITLAKRVCI